MIRSLSLHKDLTFFNHYKHLNTYRDTPQQPHSISEDKKLFYIYYHIKNLFFNVFGIIRYTFISVPVSYNPCNNHRVSD